MGCFIFQSVFSSPAAHCQFHWRRPPGPVIPNIPYPASGAKVVRSKTSLFHNGGDWRFSHECCYFPYISCTSKSPRRMRFWTTYNIHLSTPKTISFEAVIKRIIIWTTPRKVSVFGIFDVFMTPGRVFSTSPRFKIVRVLSSWNSLATTEVTLLVLTVSKTCSGQSWTTVTANWCWRNFVVDFSGLIINSSTLLRNFTDTTLIILLRVWEIPSQSVDLSLMMTSSVKFALFEALLSHWCEALFTHKRYLTAAQVFQRSENVSKGKIVFGQVLNFKRVTGPGLLFFNELKNRLLSINGSHNSERQSIGYLENASIAEWRRLCFKYVLSFPCKSFPVYSSSFDSHQWP